MVTCKDFLHELGAYLDDAGDPQARQDLEQHVTQCPNCWVVFDTTRKTIQVYKGMEPQDLPPGVENRLMQALEKKCRNRRPSA